LKAARTGNLDVLLFSDVDPEDFANSLESLRAHSNRREKYSFRIHWFSHENKLKLVMPSMLHACVSAWYSTMSLMGCPEYSNFVGAYKGSIKTPTFAFQPRGGPGLGGFPEFPNVVVESGINEPYAELQANARLWQEAQFSAPTEIKMRLFLSVSCFSPDGHQMLHDYYSRGNCSPNVEPKAAVPFSLTFLHGVADHWISAGGHLPAETALEVTALVGFLTYFPT
ncbi:hypothetical protein HOY82DRAFT_558786, partial [Tuber indicum]